MSAYLRICCNRFRPETDIARHRAHLHLVPWVQRNDVGDRSNGSRKFGGNWHDFGSNHGRSEPPRSSYRLSEAWAQV